MFHSECDQLLALEFRTYSGNEFNMEVSGRRKPAKENYFFCKHCEDRKAFNRSSGLCLECEEYMCIKCFDTHKEWKLNKGHTLTDGKDGTAKQELSKELVKCNAHPNGFVKYYCTRHHRIGCNKCMVLEHTSCKIELINDKVQNFKESPSFEEFVEGIKKCRMQSTETVSSIESKKLQLTEANDEFIRDVQEFRVEIISKVNELANAMLQQGKDAIHEDIKYMDELKQESERVMLETTALDEVLESQIGQPYKLFVSSILEGPKLTRVREQIRNLDSKTRITNYKFKRNGNLERVVKDSKQLGQIQEIKEKTEKDSEGTARPKSYTKTARAIAASKTQPLLDRQLVCRNIAVDGEYLSYAPRMPGKTGLYVLDFVTGFKVEIINRGRHGTIAHLLSESGRSCPVVTPSDYETKGREFKPPLLQIKSPNIGISVLRMGALHL
ncbi:uncharacterized protein LOC128549288 [Mercenaria mercenaria]|uniref:uncharacterized protein LOC128549288 n=1 Tax=Mercenaria mercenaria TaxID=6596 RepID=UPI00234F6A5A|nr:uncharacterized protein LOC128549288 [Mercenaria mercenaria]